MSVLKEKAKVIILPTKEPSLGCISNQVTIGRYYDIVDKAHLIVNPISNPTFKYYHLYILSDEEIKEDDYIIHKYHKNKILKAKDVLTNGWVDWLKIIATTNTSLRIEASYKKGLTIQNTTFLPQPSQGFIEKYIKEYNKGNIITEVLVIYHFIGGINGMFKSKELLIDDKNTITIHPIKTSWSREEVEDMYSIITFPEVQEYMEEDWFDEEAILDVNNTLGLGSSTYLIPNKYII